MKHSHQATTEFILAVMSKYLQMMSAYSIYKEGADELTRPDEVAKHYEHFNQDFLEICKVFVEVTNEEFKAGQKFKPLRPVAPVKPTQRTSEAEFEDLPTGQHLGEAQNRCMQLSMPIKIAQETQILPTIYRIH